jgi:predicted deacetylase
MTDSRFLIVSIHDVAPPNWVQVEKILKHLWRLGVRKRSLLVIPNFRGCWRVDEYREFAEWLCERQREGDEIILHGFEHNEVHKAQGVRDWIKNQLYTQGEGEFLALNYEEARNRIERGIAILKAAGVESSGFVAPAWLINRAGLTAVKDLGFEYTNSYTRITDFVSGKSKFVPSLVFGPGRLNEDFSLLLQRLASKLIRWQSSVRVVIHPPCVEHDRRFEGILAMIREQLLRHRPRTYSEFVRGWRKQTASLLAIPQ